MNNCVIDTCVDLDNSWCMVLLLTSPHNDMLLSVVRFSNDAAALEKTLRFFQSLATVHVGLTSSASALEIRRELALGTHFPPIFSQLLNRTHCLQSLAGRRYFRLFKWYPCFTAAYDSITPNKSTVEAALEVVKFTFLGLYFLLEACTIVSPSRQDVLTYDCLTTTQTNALRMTSFSWGPLVQDEANKCWFYALLASIALSLYHLLSFPASASRVTTDKRQDSSRVAVTDGKEARVQEKQPPSKQPPQTATRSILYNQLVIDGCDLLIPGSAVGWIPADWVTVGLATAVSTVLGGRQIWERVQAAA